LEIVLNASQSLFQTLADNSPVGIIQTDSEGLCIYVNRRWCEMAGLKPEQAYGAGWANAVYSGDRERVWDEWYRAAQTKGQFQSKYRFQKPDGTITWVFGQAFSHGSGTGHIGTITDITEITGSELDLRTAKEQYQLLFDANPLPGWVFDVETLAFLEVNEMTVSHYGYSREEFLAMTVKDIRPVEELPKLEASVKNLPPGLKRAGVWIHKKKDGTLIAVEIFNYGIVFRGRPARLVLANDVTESKHREHALQETARLTVLAETASIFAHEVANPLNGISTMLQMLLRGGEVKDLQSKEMLQDALSEIGRLGSLLQEFRTFARPESISPEPVDLKELVREVLSTEAMEYSERGIRVEEEFTPDGLSLKADRQKLKQVLLNLFKNAVEAMPDGGTLKICGDGRGDQIFMDISDTGTGIPEGARIFDAFTTTKPHGTGLGLPIVKKIVAAHGGKITYQSQPGQGTVFTLTFPASPIVAPQSGAN
jgi:PAS domain S-box-containing protein